MRVAFVGPLPPSSTGIADYDVDVLRALAGRHEIEAFSETEADALRVPPGVRVDTAAAFRRRDAAEPFDTVVYQMGNGPAHAFLYPLLAARPGLLVLHDLVLHHARARMLLDGPEARSYAAAPWRADLREAARHREDEYRAEVAYSHPEPGLADVHLGTVGRLLPYAYPLVRLPVEASRAVGAHNDYMVRWLQAHVPDVPAVRIVMPVEPLTVADADVAALRPRYRVAPDDVLVGTFGLLTPEKQVLTVARAVARVAALDPRVRLLLVGEVPDPGALERALSETGLRHRAIVTGRVTFSELAAHMALADMVAHLRYPTARETSAALLRVLAQGRATAITDLEHLRDIPATAVVRLDARDEEGALTRAILQLAASPHRRARLAQAAAAFIREQHSPRQCAESYEQALAVTVARPQAPRPFWPAHWSALRA